MLRLSIVLALALGATTLQAQQAVNPKPMSDEERAQINAQRRAGCKAHEENLKLLKGNDKLEIVERGKNREITKEERAAQVAETERIIKEYCSET